MNLATPAPRVEAAIAEKAPTVEIAEADSPTASESVCVEPAQQVEPAVIIDHPKKFAPSNVTNPKREPPKSLSVEVLRGVDGADFESEAAVLLREPLVKSFYNKLLPFLAKNRSNFVSYGEVVRFVLIKNGCCFVFAEKTDLAPLYTIPLEEFKPVVEDPRKPGSEAIVISPSYSRNATRDSLATVLLKHRDGNNNNNSKFYQFTFDASKDKSTLKRFVDAVQNCGKNSRPVDTKEKESALPR